MGGRSMTILLLALLIGIVAGLRAMTAPAAVAFAAVYGPLDLVGTPLSFMEYTAVPWVLAVLAIGELVTDQLPSTPSRKVPVQFGTRILLGGFSGAVLGATAGQLAGGAIAGVIGAVLGTLGGAAIRARMAAAFRADRPAALIEDAVAIVAGFLIAWSA
jgi:uncharacterized membrane protein